MALWNVWGPGAGAANGLGGASTDGLRALLPSEMGEADGGLSTCARPPRTAPATIPTSAPCQVCVQMSSKEPFPPAYPAANPMDAPLIVPLMAPAVTAPTNVPFMPRA